MYIYDRKLSGAQSLLKEQPITSRPAQRNSYYPDRGISGFVGRGGSSGSYVWANEGLGKLSTEILTPPPNFGARRYAVCRVRGSGHARSPTIG